MNHLPKWAEMRQSSGKLWPAFSIVIFELRITTVLSAALPGCLPEADERTMLFSLLQLSDHCSQKFPDMEIRNCNDNSAATKDNTKVGDFGPIGKEWYSKRQPTRRNKLAPFSGALKNGSTVSIALILSLLPACIIKSQSCSVRKSHNGLHRIICIDELCDHFVLGEGSSLSIFLTQG
jgi:hypothetical protein